MSHDAVLESLALDLQRASELLGNSASRLKQTTLNRSQNFERLADAIRRILEVEQEIYGLRPDLRPEHLKEGWDSVPPAEKP
jgi:hypothetical protein